MKRACPDLSEARAAAVPQRQRGPASNPPSAPGLSAKRADESYSGCARPSPPPDPHPRARGGQGRGLGRRSGRSRFALGVAAAKKTAEKVAGSRGCPRGGSAMGSRPPPPFPSPTAGPERTKPGWAPPPAGLPGGDRVRAGGEGEAAPGAARAGAANNSPRELGAAGGTASPCGGRAAVWEEKGGFLFPLEFETRK